MPMNPQKRASRVNDSTPCPAWRCAPVESETKPPLTKCRTAWR